MNKKNLLQSIRSIIIIIIGNFIFALSTKLFIIPADLITGGATGIALAINHASGFSISAFIFIFNIVMLIAGFFLLGKQFALTTVLSSITCPLFLEILNRTIADFLLTDNIFLCTVFSGLGYGLALGLVIREGSSTGGMDIPPLVLNKYFKFPVSVSMYVFDVIILLIQIPFQSMEKVLYAIIHVIVYSILLDKLLLSGTSSTQVQIISRKSKEICADILSQLDRGVTLIPAKGGYSGENRELVLSVISNRELPRIERILRNQDPEGFMIVSRVTEVRGEGFTWKKK